MTSSLVMASATPAPPELVGHHRACEHLDMSDDVARLLAHPLRQRLLVEYDTPTSPSRAARRIRQPVNVVSYHTGVLRRRGWIELVRTEQRRGAVEHFYRSTGPPELEDSDWARLSQRVRRAIVLGTLGTTADEAKA